MKRMKPRHQGLLAFLVTLAVATIVFTAWPQADLAMAGWFYRDAAFVGNEWAWSQAVYRWFPRLGAVVLVWSAAVVVWSAVAARWRPAARRPHRSTVRAASMLLLVSLIAVGAIVHGVLKERSGRPRPSQVTQFQGSLPFQRALQVSRACTHNCSFVSGHAAGGFALIALGLLGTRRTRLRWWLVGTATGTVIGIARMSQGSHFASDIVFALLVVWGLSLALRAAWVHGAALRRRARARGRNAAPEGSAFPPAAPARR